jgi:pSer/pThr/pTyr-binding forkhead associated (FHA) protein
VTASPLYLYVRDPIDGDRVVPVRTRAALGRDLTCEVVVGDAEASRRHAELRTLPAGTWQLRDLGSTNGTYVNERRVVGAVDVSAGDVVRIGRVSIELHLADPTPAELLPG